ncbi:MAG TPA: hypothetical protein DHW42_05445 [Candidatus Marinimicrobia bacterium]|nr:hypothetical protein [Candidatus Neomarinimicrobiota bacterium]
MSDISSKLKICGLAWFLSFNTVMNTVNYKIFKTNSIINIGWEPGVFAGFKPFFQEDITS